MNIHLSHHGHKLGAFSMEQVQDMIKAGVITHDTLSWTEGQAEWKPLKEILTRQAPPPLPVGATAKVAASGLTPDSTKSSDAPQSHSLIEITATSARQACEIISSHVTPFLEQGWKVEQGFVLSDGWKNSCTLQRGNEQRTMDFDL
jgi:hypothetical protein